MNQLFKFGLILSVICLAATLVLATAYRVTQPAIDKELKQKETGALKSMLPEAGSFVKKELDEIEYFEALKGKNLVGYCVKAVGNGYGGFIRIIFAMDTNGIIKGVRILAHTETPGMGAKINETKPGENEPWFLRRFVGKDAKTVFVKENIDAISGATISSKAITDAINKAANEFLSKVKK